MEKIKLGSLCITRNNKSFESDNKTLVIKKGTYVRVCDDSNISKNYVLVEPEGFDDVFGYELSELILIKNDL